MYRGWGGDMEGCIEGYGVYRRLWGVWERGEAYTGCTCGSGVYRGCTCRMRVQGLRDVYKEPERIGVSIRNESM